MVTCYINYCAIYFCISSISLKYFENKSYYVNKNNEMEL